MKYALPLLLLLPACDAGLPSVDGAISAASLAQEAPDLVPLDDLLVEGTRVSRAAPAQTELQVRGGRLAGASIDAPATGDLDARGRELRARADRLRATEI